MDSEAVVGTSQPHSYFLLCVRGEISTGHFMGIDNIYWKGNFVHGADWQVVAGHDEMVSQVAKRSSTCFGSSKFVFNMPFSVTYQSTNPFGWPQLVLSVYGLDAFGNDVVRGYGCVHVPTVPGVVERCVHLSVPEASSTVQRWASYITGRRPELTDARIMASGNSRELIRMVQLNGDSYLRVRFDVITRDIAKHGYALGQSYRDHHHHQSSQNV